VSSDLQDIDAVLLDAGGVLVLPDPKLMRAAFAPLGATPDDETCRFAHYAGMREVDRLGEADWSAVDRVVARSAGVPEDRLDEVLPAVSRIYLA
jgi:putative hydrolase of the HAD superfamily